MSSSPPITDSAIAALDLAAAETWRGTEQEPLGDWLLRAAGGFTGRANSVLTIGDPGLPLPEAAARVRRWYTARGLPPMAVVSYPIGQPGQGPVDQFFAAQGWRLRDEAAVIVMTRPAADVEPAPPPPFPIRFDDTPSDDWLALYHFRGQPDLPPIARTVLTSAPWQSFASARDGSRTVAIGRVAAAGEWAGLTAIEVDPAYRRRGLAVAVTTALIARAAAHSTPRIYLQVEDANAPALALYHRLGFTTHHAYHYWVAPTT
jgi:N-acetylglutamate synthase